VVPVCVWFVVCTRQQLAQADWPDPSSSLFNLRAASRLAQRWRVAGFGVPALAQSLALGPQSNQAARLR